MQCFIYLDEIIVSGSTFEDCMQQLECVLSKLAVAGLQLNPSKCHFAHEQVQYLGHHISQDGI